MTKMVSVGALALLLAGWGFASILLQETASADNTDREVLSENKLTFFETLTNDLGVSVDVYQIRCLQVSNSLNVTVTDSGAGGGDNLIFSLVATGPATVLGQGKVAYVPAAGSNSASLIKTPKAAALKGMLSVWGNGLTFGTYQMDAECINDIKGTRNTNVILQQDQ